MEWLLSTATEQWRLQSAVEEDLCRLRIALPKIRILIDKAEQWRFNDTNLANLLTELNDAFYDAEEREKVIGLLLLLQSSDGSGPSNTASVPTKRIKRENISVLTIYGIGGVGKTTLAQIVYNDQRVQENFELQIWVCVSEPFHVKRLTKDVIDNAKKGYKTDQMSLDSLQVLLKEMLMSERFLLVLDDVWNEDVITWEKFYAPFRSTHKGSVIIATTRSQNVAGIVGTMDPILLKGLPDESYWQLFKRYAFGRENSEVNQELEDIAEKIAAKFEGISVSRENFGKLVEFRHECETVEDDHEQ